MALPQAKDVASTGDGNEMMEVRFLVPRSWLDELKQAAHVQRISLADLMRIVTRGFLRDRYSEDEQRRMGLI